MITLFVKPRFALEVLYFT